MTSESDDFEAKPSERTTSGGVSFCEVRMHKIVLAPLESQVAEVLAERRGICVETLIANLLRDEAAIELANWRRQASANPLPKPEPATKANLR